MTKQYLLVSLKGELYMIDKEAEPQYGNQCFYPTIGKGEILSFDKDEIWHPKLC